MSVKIYLAGPVADRDDSGAGWREAIKTEYGDEFEFLDPLDKYDPRDDGQPTAREIVESDLDLVMDADALLVRYDGEATWGTPMEVQFAHRRDTPVALTWLGESPISPWAEFHCDYLRSTTAGALSGLAAHFNGRDESKFGPDVEPYNPADDIEAAYEARSDGGNDRKMPAGDTLAAMLADDVATLLTDSRDSHGDAVENQQHIADAWSWYLGVDVDGVDVARMMELVKMSRAVVGEYDIDHDRDIAGYASIAAACAVASGAAELDDLQEHAGTEVDRDA